MIFLKKRAYLISLLIVFILAGFGAGFLFGRTSSKENILGLNINEPEGADLSVFWEAWNLLEEKYVDREKLDKQEMIYGAISGMFKSLGDPYSVFMSPQEAENFSDNIKGEFGGIGAEVGIRNGALTIVAPLEDSPAKKAGLRAGDKVLKIDDVLTADLTLDEGVNLIRGEKGTEVVLTIMREDDDETKEIKVVRDEIKIPVLQLETKNKIAHIKLFQFTENLPDEFKKVAQRILSSDAKGIILDLRDNPGGYLETAVEITGWFLPERSLVVYEDFGEGVKREHFSSKNGKLASFPLVVLVNGGSASGSEIVAGALRDIRGTELVGEKTFGKGSVQQLEELTDNSSVKLTVAKWLTPSGLYIHENGIEPDIKVEITQEDLDNLRDPQLDKAIEALLGL